MKREKQPDTPWNEGQWERFMLKSDVRAAKFGELLETLIDHPNRDEIIDHEMGWDKPLPPPDDDEEPFEPPDLSDIDPNDEEIKEMMRRDEEALHAIPAYTKGFKYGLKVHKFLKKYLEVEEDEPDEDIVSAFSNSLIIAAKIAGGHGMGYDDDVLCGNIVCCKRSLEAARKCLESLESLKARSVIPAKTLDPLIAEGEDIRRLVEERIAELRSRVWW